MVETYSLDAFGNGDENVCSLHGKRRGAANLHVVDGAYVCKPGGECRGGDPATEHCAFFAEGRCAKGDACPYIHDVRRVNSKGGGGGGQLGPGGGKLGPAGGGKLGPAKGCQGKTSWMVADDWGWPDKGGGKLGPGIVAYGPAKGAYGGKGCHGKDPWSAAGDWGWKGNPAAAIGSSGCYGKGKPGKDSSKELETCWIQGKKRSWDVLVQNRDGSITCAPGSECREGADTNQLCSFFMSGACQKGDACKFIHPGQAVGGSWDRGHAMGGAWGKGEAHAMGGAWGKGKAAIPQMGGMQMGGKQMGGKGGKGKPGSDEAGAAMCSTHGKVRSLNNLDEISPGEFACREGMDCRGNSGTKEALCKFFEQDQCKKGEFCKFAHGEEQLGDPVLEQDEPPQSHGLHRQEAYVQEWAEPESDICAIHGKKRGAQNLMMSADGLKCCKPGSECATVSADTHCKFFAQGRCSKGESCQFSHGDQVFEQEEPPQSHGLHGQDAYAQEWAESDICAIHGKKRGSQNLMMSADGLKCCKPGSECAQVSADTQCKFYAQGRCSKGTSCPFVHDENAQIVAPAMDSPLKGAWGPKGCGKGKKKGYSPY